MPKLLWEVKTLVCDICRENEVKTTIQVSRGVWKGVCAVCEAKLIEAKNDNLLQNNEVR